LERHPGKEREMTHGSPWRTRARLLAFALGALLIGGGGYAQAGTKPSYKFTRITSLGQPAPGGGNFTNDFEPTALNDRGDAAFTADLTTGGEGVFLSRKGVLTPVVRTGAAAPGGGTFAEVELGRLGLNNSDHLAVPFTLEPLTFPAGSNSGLFRFADGTLSAVARPGDPAPGGGTFDGVFFHTSLNDNDVTVFTGIVNGADIDPALPPGDSGRGAGLYAADALGTLSSVVRPGDAAPGGGVFDAAMNGSINNAGDIAFGAHVAGEECIDIGSPFVCGESLYLRNASTGVTQSVAHQGDPAPGGGNFRLAFGGVVNARRDVAFIGDLSSPPSVFAQLGVFLYSKGTTLAVARPGDAMPGGGHMQTAGLTDATYDINNRTDVSFTATLDTGPMDNGLYVYSKGSVRLVARSGTVIPGVGTIAYLGAPVSGSPSTRGGIINARGQLLFAATLTDSTGVLLTATP
jgi:hypothetical protein